MENKVIGVLGGYGPYATAQFYKLISDLTPAVKDWDHLHLIIDSNPRVPSRARSFLFDEESPVEYMLEGIKRLEKAGADFFICPCNTAHYFLRQIKDRFSLDFMDMVELVVEEVANKGIKNLGILGTEVIAQSGMYDELLVKKGVKVTHVDDVSLARQVIECGKTNKNMEEGREILKGLIRNLQSKGAEGVLYGCTEFPLVIPSDEINEYVIFDTSKILAKRIIDMVK